MSCCSCELVAFAFATAVMWSFSSRARYYLKMFVFMIGCTVLVVVPGPFMLLRPRDYRNALLPAYGCVKLGKLLGIDFELRGLENIDRSKGGVVLINHQSALDLIVLAMLWPIIGRATVVAKKAVFYLLPFGIPCWLWGTIFIDRHNRQSSLTTINKESIAISEKQAKLLFFPEGTRNQEEYLLPFKKGPFVTAIQSSCPLIPVVVSRYHFLDSKRKIFGRGHSVISILPEIPTAGVDKSDMDVLINNTRNVMQAEYQKLSDEVMAINNINAKGF